MLSVAFKSECYGGKTLIEVGIGWYTLCEVLMKIVCCANMPYAKEAFSTLGETLIKDGRIIAPADVRDAQVLAIRSTTVANQALLDGSSVKFVGTATIGTDHMDTAWFEREGIRWCYAPGCNANSVSEYVTAALLCLANRHGFALDGKTVGVIGVGHVGSLVVKKAEALGMRVLRNDPPKEEEARSQKSGVRSQRTAKTGREGINYVSLDKILAESDIITLHVPLTRTGPYATYHMADGSFFGKMKRGGVFFNCARGATVDTDALLTAMDKGIVAHAVIDTWEGEPVYRTDLLNRVDIGTPHIAGHSFEGKVMGTVMVYQEACKFLGMKAAWSPDNLLPPPLVPEVDIDASGKSDEAVLRDIVRRVYDIEADDRRMRQGGGLDDKARGVHFDGLRKNYPMRREFRFTRGVLQNPAPGLVSKVARLGFHM